MLNNFLFCLELETSGFTMGWTGITSNLFAIGLLSVFVFHDSAFTVSAIYDLSAYYVNATTHGNDSSLKKEEIANMLTGLGVLLTIFLLVVVYAALALRLWASINLVYGTKKRSSKHIYRYVIVDLIFLIPQLGLMFLTLDIVCYDILMFYLSVCTYSFYKEIQNEEETRISSDTVLKSVANSGESPEGVQVPANQHPQADQQPYTFKELLKYFEANQ